MKTIVFAGGGTGGHIYPGLAVADELKALAPNVRVVWFGSSAGRDKEMVCSNKNERGLPSADSFVGIPSGKLRRYFSLNNVFDLFKVIAGFFVSLFYLAKIKPAAVFSKGGFVSVPPCAAAKVLHIPVYTHECDFSPGLATRINSRFASRILLSYEESRRFFPERMRNKLFVTGNPVRPVFYAADAKKGLLFLGLAHTKHKPILLVLGGSSGARQINNLVFENLDWLCERFTVVHQTGKGDDFEKARFLAQKINGNADIKTNAAAKAEKTADAVTGDAGRNRYVPYDFIYNDMPDVLSACDIVFSRSGANTLWESAVCAKPMLLLPLAGSGTRGDQAENAARFEKCGAALVCDSLKDERALSAEVKDALEKLRDERFRLSMGKCALKAVGTEKSARKIADMLYGSINKK